MQILIDDASAAALLSGPGMRVLLFCGPTDSTAVTRFSGIRWPAGVVAAVLTVAAAPLTAASFGISRTPAVGAIVDGRLVALETDHDPRAAAVRAVTAARARAGPRDALRRAC